MNRAQRRAAAKHRPKADVFHRMQRRIEREAVEARTPCLECGQPVVEGDVMALVAKEPADDTAMHFSCADRRNVSTDQG